MKNVMIAIAFIATVALASCGNAPESTAPANDSTMVATDSTSCDTTCKAICVDTTTVK
jgi:hypothetical protein